LSAGDGASDDSSGNAAAAEVQLALKAQMLLERDLRNPKIVLPQLELLCVSPRHVMLLACSGFPSLILLLIRPRSRLHCRPLRHPCPPHWFYFAQLRRL
jgi:hypothetical protein